MIPKSVMLNISNRNRNVAILVKMRGLTMFGVKPLPRYRILSYVQPF